MAITIAEVQYTPNPMVAGGKVKATCKVECDSEIASVKMYTPDYRTLEAHDTGNGIFALETDVPYDAPSGMYDVTLVATAKNGDVSRKTVPVKIG